MNKVIMMGSIAKEPDIKYSKGEKSTAIANFTLAVSRKYKREGQPDADFFNCCAYGKTAETIEKYCSKGTKLTIVGSLQNDNYEKDGQKHTNTKINVDEFEFAESKNSSSGSAASNEVKDSSGNPYPKFSGNDGFMNIPDGTCDDLPFA